MAVCDPIAERHADLIDVQYDSVDRLVLNGYIRFLITAGGFRTWWRSMFGGDSNLSDKRLKRMAADFALGVRRWAKEHDIPLCEVGAAPDNRPSQFALEHLPRDPDFTGVFCVTVSRCKNSIWRVDRFGESGLHLHRETQWANHYSFHIIDPEWGHVTFKMCGYPPFTAQIIFNGHECLAQQLSSWNLDADKAGNCFTRIADPAAFAERTAVLASDTAREALFRVCERWLYSSCLCFAIPVDDQRRTGLVYDYSVFQAEYCRNYLFRLGGKMDEFFDRLIDRVRSMMNVRQIKTIFGTTHRPHRSRKTGRPGRIEVRVEHPEYDLTVFKVHFGKLMLKMYSKGENVLRFEVVAHNTKDLRCGRVLRHYAEIVARLKLILDNFVDVVSGMEAPWMPDDTWDTLSQPSQRGKNRIAGIDLNKPRMRHVTEALLSLAASPDGFTVTALAECVSQEMRRAADDGRVAAEYGVRQAAYDLKKFRAKGMVERVVGSQAYRLQGNSLRTLAAVHVLRTHVILPLIRRRNHLQTGRPPKNQTTLDRHHHELQRAMRQLFQNLSITI